MKRLVLISLLFLVVGLTGCAYWGDPWGPYPVFNPQPSNKAKTMDYFKLYQYDYPAESEYITETEYDNS